MTKKDIVKKIASEMRLSQNMVHDIVQRTFDEIVESMIRDGRIELRNFGVFEIRVRAPRKARNPQTNERLELPERAVVAFKPGKEMAERVAGLPVERLAGTSHSRHAGESGGSRPAAGGENRPGASDTPG